MRKDTMMIFFLEALVIATDQWQMLKVYGFVYILKTAVGSIVTHKYLGKFEDLMLRCTIKIHGIMSYKMMQISISESRENLEEEDLPKGD